MKNILYSVLICSLLFTSCKNPSEENKKEISENPVIAKVENGLIPGMVLKGDSITPFTLKDGMEDNKVIGLSIAVLNDGTIDWAKGYGVANTESNTAVNTTTLFQAASISKPITALAILKLMEEGKVDLYTDVNTYLNDWKVPSNKFTVTEKVTLYRLLTHSAGTTVHGFPGYKQTDSFPSTYDVLSGKGNTATVDVDAIPGSRFKYSGGGYTIVQKVIEDITQMPFEEYMDNNILKPLGMTQSTFSQPLSKKLHNQASAAYDDEGKLIEGLWNNYPEKAAAGLWTTPTDLLKYAMEIQQIKAGKTDGLLKPKTVELMLTKNEHGHGLGPGITEEDGRSIFVHGGKNEGYTNVFIAFVDSGNGVAIMTNSDNGGDLLGPIERAVSAVYDWNLSNPKTIDPIDLSEDYLKQFTGAWKYVEQVPSVGGDYISDARIENGKLVILDRPEQSDYNFIATDSLAFLDMENNVRIYFKKNESNEIVLWWNNTFEFHRIKE